LNRKVFVSIHLYLAAFLTPILLMIAISGGLYLLGFKGNLESNVIYEGDLAGFEFNSDDRKSVVDKFLKENNINLDYEYIKGGKNSFFTRPTSKTYLSFERKGNSLKVTQRKPDFIKSIVELHKGHGPLLFKTLQKITAVGLILVLLTGFYLGLTSPSLKNKTLAISGAGGLIFILLAIF